jgi:prevent-host-death family protein
MTTVGYDVTMNGVRIADLKSRLSEYLRKVRSGRSITVLDRDTPIARILPYEAEGASLKVRAPLRGTPKVGRVALPPPLSVRKDIVMLLLEERQGER